MKMTFPHIIENGLGEKLIFHALEHEPDGDRLVGENFVVPGSGPPMHTHWLQDESLTVVSGKLAYQVQGQPVQYAGEGETVVFGRGQAHRFWNDGDTVLHCTAWIKPAHNFAFFITEVFASQRAAGRHQPEAFTGAYLLTRYASEFEMHDIPPFVKKAVLPATVLVGRALGKYTCFQDAPPAVVA
ncbi:cupin domain-containing protein [Hymenobacter busanensis]|uniref:Cupin domain-containing protein n=1 Tax=Hymenobacter busanensis TaxID=2607656 RepID=A0A7L5A379_9BACT|nr:cupin domain-containing protein [Hymenobacter busanensis]KAA9327064.1 cupin domain-containing protein [Hymenobacter busanensis]QHJ09515.1 cupin domain-containing protein [Hymenobacter busanensis]